MYSYAARRLLTCPKILSSLLKTKTTLKVMCRVQNLKFQGNQVIQTTVSYEQVHAIMVMDAKEELKRVDVIKPPQTPAICFKSTGVTTRQSSSILGFSSSVVFGSPFMKAMVSGHLGAESLSYLEMRNYGSWITQCNSHGVVWWGLNIDDPHAQESGMVCGV